MAELALTPVRILEVPRTCELRPVTDDMAICHPSLQKGFCEIIEVEDEPLAAELRRAAVK